jgi:hypothetical protein
MMKCLEEAVRFFNLKFEDLKMKNKKIKFGESVWKMPFVMFFFFYFVDSYISSNTSKHSFYFALYMSGASLIYKFLEVNYFQMRREKKV